MNEEKRFKVIWCISGYTIIIAESKKQAREKWNNMSFMQMYQGDTDFEVHGKMDGSIEKIVKEK